MAIRITEKEHWKERIQNKINRKIDLLKSSDPQFFQRSAEEARTIAVEKLGITAQLKEIADGKAAIDKLRKRDDQLETEVYEKVFAGEKPPSYQMAGKIQDEVTKVSREAFAKILSKHKLGREIAKLEEERDNILDTVWLATSSKQVTGLWLRVLTLLGEEATDFQKDILSQKPEAED